MDCTYCRHPIAGDAPTTTLMCHHTYHTFCLIALWEDTEFDIFDFHCHECNVGIRNDIPREMVPDLDAPRPGETEDIQSIEQLYSNNPEFKQGMKEVMKSHRESARLRKPLMAMIKSKKAEAKPLFKDFEMRLKAPRDLKMMELKDSDEYKSYMRKIGNHNRLVSKFVRKTGHPLYRIRRGLKNKVGRSTLERLCYEAAPSWLLRRAFRYRIRL